jgi:hypothetical protein
MATTFFLTIEEIIAVPGGNPAPLDRVAERRAAHQRHQALPPLPC